MKCNFYYTMGRFSPKHFPHKNYDTLRLFPYNFALINIHNFMKCAPVLHAYMGGEGVEFVYNLCIRMNMIGLCRPQQIKSPYYTYIILPFCVWLSNHLLDLMSCVRPNR